MTRLPLLVPLIVQPWLMILFTNLPTLHNYRPWGQGARITGNQGCIFFILPHPGAGGGQKYKELVVWGKNMMIYSEKNANIRGKRWKNREKWEIFTVLWGKISFLKRGGGKNILLWTNIHPWIGCVAKCPVKCLKRTTFPKFQNRSYVFKWYSPHRFHVKLRSITRQFLINSRYFDV